MRSFIILFLFGFLAINVNAQSLQVVSTNPSDQAEAVVTDSIEITFNAKINFESLTLLTDTTDSFFEIVPEDSVIFSGMRLSADSLSIILDVTLTTDTDFIAIVSDVEGLNGEYLESPYLFQFTTSATRGEYVVEGTIGEEMLAKIHDEAEYEDIVVFLSGEVIEFGNDDCFDEFCEEDEIEPLYAAFVDSETGDFSISGAREGTYYPFALEFYGEEEFDEEECFDVECEEEEEEEDFFFDFPEIYFYDENGDLSPDPIRLNATTAPNDTLTGIQLVTFELEPFTLQEALFRAQSVIDSLENDPTIAGASTVYSNFIEFGSLDDDFDNEGDDAIIPMSKIAGTLFSEEEESDDYFNLLDIFSSTDGTQIEWEIYGYDAVKDSVFSIYVDPFGAYFSGYFSTLETDVPDSVDFNDIKGIPETFIDSDSAAYLFEMEIGAEFKDIFSSDYDTWFMDFSIEHTFWEYPFDSTSDSPITWQGLYIGLSSDEFTGEILGVGFAAAFLDAETGEVLYSDLEFEFFDDLTSRLTFDEAAYIADSILTTYPNSPEIVGGVTRYNNYDIVFDDEFDDGMDFSTAKTAKAVMAKITDDSTAFMIDPDGYGFSWEIFAYDSVKDSSMVFNITEFDYEFYGYFTEDSIDGDFDFSEIKLLPESHIDSDSAMAIIEEAGGGDFLDNLYNSELYWSWDIELQILHEYWNYPLDPTPSAPVTWRADFYAYAFDEDTFEVLEDSLVIYLDAETGEVLFNSMPVSNEEEVNTPEAFSLLQNYPNPFNPSTNIPFTLNTTANVEITIYSILGQKIATITDQLYSAGAHQVTWDASAFSSGMYIYQMRSGGFTETRKLLLVK